MNQRELGTSGLAVSAVGLGCMGMSHAYGTAPDRREMTELLAEAVDMGYTFFDTAEVYGTPEEPHHNETLLGKSLKSVRDKIVIATKFGLRFDVESGKVPYPLVPDSRPETIRRSVEGSLSRLQTDHIDLYYLHRVDPSVPIEEVADVMQNLMQEGKILHWGISEATEEVIRLAHKICPITAVENRYSMMARHYEPLFPVLEELGIGFVAFSPLANGLLTDCYDKSSTFEIGTDYRSTMPQFRPESFDANRQLLELIRELAEEKQATPAQVSLAWMLTKKPWIVPIPGTRKLSRLRENAGAADIELTTDEVECIDLALDILPMSEVFGGTSMKRSENEGQNS